MAIVAGADEPVAVAAVEATVRRAFPFAELSTEAFEGVLDMLAGRYPSDEFAELRPRLVWDLVGTLAARAGPECLPSPPPGPFPTGASTGSSTSIPLPCATCAPT